ncbi:hypothetical protein GN956_G7248 [Arapaima gigas]
MLSSSFKSKFRSFTPRMILAYLTDVHSFSSPLLSFQHGTPSSHIDPIRSSKFHGIQREQQRHSERDTTAELLLGLET